MANFRYFAECGGQAVEMTGVWHDGHASTSAKHFTGRCVCGEQHTATRAIEYKPHASKHECDARCLNATGKIMRCECACGGKNHGRGSSMASQALPAFSAQVSF